jgi:SAM-dependent methyltransferase
MKMSTASFTRGTAGPTPKDLAVQAGRAEVLLGFARARTEKISRHLDIGCSAGMLLQYFQGTYHCQPVGVEPGRAYRDYAQRQGLRVYPSLEELRASGEGPFDLVSLAHVLEHIPEPVTYLDSLRKTLLAPDGRLLVEVPNLYAHDSFEVAHLVAYSPTPQPGSAEGRFRVLTGSSTGSRFTLIPLYITAWLARPRRPFQSSQITASA